MTCLSVPSEIELRPADRFDLIRASVFWGFILAVIVSPAALGALILLRG